MKYKQDDSRRTRSKDLGIKASEEERQKLLKICKELGITKIQFLINAMEQYKEVLN